MRQHGGRLQDFGREIERGTPFGLLIAEAFDMGMVRADWAVVNNLHADSALVGALRSLWASEMLRAFAAHYDLAG